YAGGLQSDPPEVSYSARIAVLVRHPGLAAGCERNLSAEPDIVGDLPSGHLRRDLRCAGPVEATRGCSRTCVHPAGRGDSRRCRNSFLADDRDPTELAGWGGSWGDPAVGGSELALGPGQERLEPGSRSAATVVPPPASFPAAARPLRTQ